jgi:hypothetical protein
MVKGTEEARRGGQLERALELLLLLERRKLVSASKSNTGVQGWVTEEVLNMPEERRRCFLQIHLLLFLKDFSERAAESVWVADRWNHEAGLS